MHILSFFKSPVRREIEHQKALLKNLKAIFWLDGERLSLSVSPLHVFCGKEKMGGGGGGGYGARNRSPSILGGRNVKTSFL